MENALIKQVEHWTQSSIIASTPLGGGSVGQAQKIQTASGLFYFLKYADTEKRAVCDTSSD